MYTIYCLKLPSLLCLFHFTKRYVSISTLFLSLSLSLCLSLLFVSLSFSLSHSLSLFLSVSLCLFVSLSQSLCLSLSWSNYLHIYIFSPYCVSMDSCRPCLLQNNLLIFWMFVVITHMLFCSNKLVKCKY